jgi:hypothetical protein
MEGGDFILLLNTWFSPLPSPVLWGFLYNYSPTGISKYRDYINIGICGLSGHYALVRMEVRANMVCMVSRTSIKKKKIDIPR